MTKPITVGELRKHLERFQQDLPVSIEHRWEYVDIRSLEQITEERLAGESQVVISTDVGVR